MMKLKVTFGIGTDREDAALAMLRLAKQLDVEVQTTFNGCLLHVFPNQSKLGALCFVEETWQHHEGQEKEKHK